MTYAELLDHPDYLTWVRVLREFPDRAIIFADKLEEWGFDERAEFIRVQCELDRLDLLYADRHRNCRCDGGNNLCAACTDERDWKARRTPVSARFVELGTAHKAEWTSVPGFDPYPQACDFVNGFPMWWEMDAESWLRNGDAIYRYHPVREVELTTRPAIAVGPPDRAKLDERDCWFSGFDRPTVAVSYLANPDVAADRIANSLFSTYWPDVEFKLPPPIGVPESIQAISRRFRAGLALSLSPTTSPRPESPPE